MPYQKVTFLEDLDKYPDIDTMGQQQPNTDKFLKKNHKAPLESGMSIYDQPPPSHTKKYDPMYNQMDYKLDPNYRRVQEDYYEPTLAANCNCQDLYNHYSECHICQKFYKSETTIYLVIIAILMITCALLAKKVLNV
jgi:hypothetical protein